MKKNAGMTVSKNTMSIIIVYGAEQPLSFVMGP